MSVAAAGAPAPGGVILDQAALEAWGRRIGTEATPPLFIALRGPLGAGKSVLARAIARGAGVTEAVPSPTYNLLLRYAVDRGTLVHLDLYRLADPDELWELGWQDLGADDEVVLVEWPERAGPHLPDARHEVLLAPVAGHPGLREVFVSTREGLRALPPLPAGAAAP